MEEDVWNRETVGWMTDLSIRCWQRIGVLVDKTFVYVIIPIPNSFQDNKVVGIHNFHTARCA